MTKRFAQHLTLVLWLLSGLIVAAGVIYYRRLDQRVATLRGNEIALRRAIQETRRERDAVASERDDLSVNLILLKNAIIGYSDHVGNVNAFLKRNCPSSSQAQCRRFYDYGRLLNFHEFTLITRAAAKTPGAYAVILDRYRKTAEMVERYPWLQSQEKVNWLAASDEGVAYSLLKLGRPAEALPPIRQASTMTDGRAAVVLTYLKVQCANGMAARDVRDAYDRYRAALHAREVKVAGSPAASVDRRNAEFNVELFAADQELRRYCGYAGLGRNGT